MHIEFEETIKYLDGITRKTRDSFAAQCVDYVLEHAGEYFEEHVKNGGAPINHVYFAACVASGNERDILEAIEKIENA